MAQKPTRYQQIADELRWQIESGELPRESRLPTEIDLQARFHASRNTVRDAIKLLVAERLLEARGGREGTWVAKAYDIFVTTLSTDPKTGLSGIGEEGSTYPALVRQQNRQNAGAKAPEVAVLKGPPQIAQRLQISESDFVVSRHQERYVDNTIWSLQTSYYPMEWVQRGALRLLEPVDIVEGAVEYLTNIIGLKQDSYRDLLRARQPNEHEKALFNLTLNHTVIEVYRTSFAEDKTPIRVTVTVYPADRNQIVYDIGPVPDRGEEPVQQEPRAAS